MLGLGLALTNFGSKGGISDIADGGLLSSTFLTRYGPYGAVMDFTDASITINDSTDVLDYSSQGTVSSTTGALLGPGAKLTNTAPPVKLTEQADGYLAFQAHNLYLNSASPANQSITVVSGASYAVSITGSVSVTASGAATGTWTAGTNTFTAATTTLTLGSTSGSGTVHVRRTPSVSTYVATTSAAVYDLPYVYRAGVKTGIMVEPAATNLWTQSNDLTNAAWSIAGVTRAAQPAGVYPSSTLLTEDTSTGTHRIYRSVALTGSTVYTFAWRVKRGTGSRNIFTIAQNGANLIYAWFNLDTVAVHNSGAGGTGSLTAARITAQTGGWYLLELVGSPDTASASYFNQIYLANTLSTGSTNPSYTGDGTSSLEVSIPQVETGTVATSPIITYGSSVVRAVDTDTSLLNLFPSLGSAYTMYIRYKPASTAVATTGLRLDDTTANELVSIGNNASGQGLATVTDGGVSQASITDGTITSSAFHRLAVSVEANNVLFVVNGGTGVQDTSVSLPTLTRMLLGNTSGQLITQIALFPGARTEAQLQAIGA